MYEYEQGCQEWVEIEEGIYEYEGEYECEHEYKVELNHQKCCGIENFSEGSLEPEKGVDKVLWESGQGRVM